MPLSQDKSHYIDTIDTKSYEGDINNKLKLSALLRHMQQIGIDQVVELEAEGLVSPITTSAFLLSKMDVRITRMPKAGERLTFITAPQPPVKAQFMRYYAVSDSAGLPVAESLTSWLLFDWSERRILRPSAYPFGFEMKEMGELTGRDMDKLRLSAPAEVREVASREIRYSDIDLNGHLNNTVYADIVCDTLPFELMSTLEPARLQLHFISEAKAGDVLKLCVGEAEDSYFVSGEKEDGHACFAARLSFKKI